MSLIVAGIMLGASTIAGAKSNQLKKSEERHAANLAGISNDIQKWQGFANAAIASQELQDQFIGDESTATATVAAQNRRSSSGSAKAISKERKRMLDKNIKTIDENAKTNAAMLDLNTMSGKRAAQASGKTGDWAQVANLAGNVAKIFG